MSTWAWDACWRVLSTTSRYFLNSPPMARAMSPNTERICGFTDLCTFSFWEKNTHKGPGSGWEGGKERREWPQAAPGGVGGCSGMFLQRKRGKCWSKNSQGLENAWKCPRNVGEGGKGRKEFRRKKGIRKEFNRKGGRNLEGQKEFGRNPGRKE